LRMGMWQKKTLNNVNPAMEQIIKGVFYQKHFQKEHFQRENSVKKHLNPVIK